jgi:hypothetical protein
MKTDKNKIETQKQQLDIPVVSSSDWVNLEYVGEPYNIEGVFFFDKGLKSGLPKEIWEKEKDKLTDWKAV